MATSVPGGPGWGGTATAMPRAGSHRSPRIIPCAWAGTPGAPPICPPSPSRLSLAALRHLPAAGGWREGPGGSKAAAHLLGGRGGAARVRAVACTGRAVGHGGSWAQLRWAVPRGTRLCHAVQTVPSCARLCQTVPGCAKLCQNVPSCTGLCQAVPNHAGLCQAVLSCARLCQTMPRCAGLCQTAPSCAKPCQVTPGRHQALLIQMGPS